MRVWKIEKWKQNKFSEGGRGAGGAKNRKIKDRIFSAKIDRNSQY